MGSLSLQGNKFEEIVNIYIYKQTSENKIACQVHGQEMLLEGVNFKVLKASKNFLISFCQNLIQTLTIMKDQGGMQGGKDFINSPLNLALTDNVQIPYKQ